MKKKSFKKIKTLSVILSLFYFSGLIWYGEFILSTPLPLILLLVSTGFALLVVPLLSDKLLSSPIIKLISVLLIGTGISGSFYMIVNAITAMVYLSDLFIEIMQHILIIAVLVLLGIRVISPQGE
ncbi:MAG: hypothetical protein HY753_04250 [Nitrospirae bacterium]|nr:hypothetical protein [Nitrospirota bacterium]